MTRERALAATHERIARERALIAGTLAHLRVLPTVGATANLICRQVARMTGVASASLAYFTPGGAVVTLAFVRTDGVPVQLRQLPFGRSRTLRERADHPAATVPAEDLEDHGEQWTPGWRASEPHGPGPR